MTDNLVK